MMSEPSQWGPPAGPRPTAPYPTAPHPAGRRPTAPHPAPVDRGAFLPTTPIPTVQAEIPRRPAPRSRPAADEYEDEDDYASGRPRRRGQVFSGLVLLMALAVSALVYYLTYQTLTSIRITSGAALAGAGGQAMSLGGVMLG